MNLNGTFTFSARNTPGNIAMIPRTKKVIITISGAPARNSIVTKMPVNTICLNCLPSRYFKKDTTTRGSHGTAKRCGRRLWTDNRYPESMNMVPPTNEARVDAFRYFKNTYTVTPENTKWRIMIQFQTTLKGRNK